MSCSVWRGYFSSLYPLCLPRVLSGMADAIRRHGSRVLRMPLAVNLGGNLRENCYDLRLICSPTPDGPTMTFRLVEP